MIIWNSRLILFYNHEKYNICLLQKKERKKGRNEGKEGRREKGRKQRSERGRREVC